MTTIFAPLACLLASLSVALVAAEEGECASLVDLACNNTDFSILCDLISMSETTNKALSSGDENWTIFAPTDAAFLDELESSTSSSLVSYSDLLDSVQLNVNVNTNCTTTAALDSLLGFHAVRGEQLYGNDLVCGGEVEMANGDVSRTICRDGILYQKGGQNSDVDMPEIIAFDVDACDGVIHVINKVMLPKLKFLSLDNDCVADADADADADAKAPEEKSCETIAELACGDRTFSTLCDLIMEFNMVDTLSGGVWTLFAPTDDAFAALDEETITMDVELNTGIDTGVNIVERIGTDQLTSKQIVDVLKYHIHQGAALAFDDLGCKKLIPMMNDKTSRTKCANGYKYQRGPGQWGGMLPQITTKDIKACNGIVQMVNHVMIPRFER